MTKNMKLVDWVVVLFILFTWSTVSFWLWWPYNPLEVHSIEILNTDKAVEQGGVLSYRLKWTKHTSNQGVVHRFFVNGHKFPLDDDDGTLASAPIGPGEAIIFMPVPYDNPCGEGRMQFTVTYPMNPLRVVVAPVIPAYSDKYTVTAINRKGVKGDQGTPGRQGTPGKTGAEGKGRGYTIFGDVKK